MMLPDSSSSTNKQAVRNLYDGGVATVVGACRGGDVLAAYPITANSQASAYRGFAVAFPAYDPLRRNAKTYREDLAKARRRAGRLGRAVIDNKDTERNTDLIFAFRLAGEQLNGSSYRQFQHKQLIVFSDGIQQTRLCDFMSVDLSDGRIAHIIDGLRAKGYLPDLHGVKVWMAGCGADPNHELSAEKTDQIRRFWLSFVRASGGDLMPDRYGTTLQNYGP